MIVPNRNTISVIVQGGTTALFFHLAEVELIRL